jgi:6-hydroxytryprostatin B O-methyltransferase
MGTLKALIGLGVPYKIPLGGSASYEKLAGEIGISSTLLTRLIRFAMTTGYFAEDGSGHVKHNSMSSVFVRNPQAGGALQWCLNVELKCAMEFQRSLQIDPMGEQRDKTPLGLAYQNHQGRPTMWSLLEKEDSFRSYFYDLMVTQCRAPMYSLNHILRAFDWNQIGTLVDVSMISPEISMNQLF